MDKTYSLPIELKALGDNGSFSGYAATFDRDLGGDIIEPNAFDAWLAANPDAQSMSVLWQHDLDKPIGVTTLMRVDQKGLYVEGQLTLGVQRADEARLLSKAGALKGMSIGYFVDDFEYVDNTRKIKALSLFEYSFVTLPMNPRAKLTSVKSFDQIETVRDAEDYLRDVGSLSQSQAKRLISIIKGTRDDVQTDEAKQLTAIAKLFGVSTNERPESNPD